MLSKTFLFLLLSFSPIFLLGQKQVYIPNEWLQGSLDYSFTRSAQSDDFIVFWGPLAGDDPTQAPGDIAFDPQTILNTAESLYKFYIDTIQFIHDDTGLISQYKIILVMLNTWTGLEGWAFGGSYDATVGAMWMHPQAASSGPTLAHEFTHTLQNYTWMMNPGHGFIDSSYVGFFWETHAEFMALQRYPSVALEFDMARWLNTCQFHWSSTRHHYQAFVFLEFIKERDGIQMINRLWNEAIIGEHPLETYKRLKGISQEELNDLFAEYAMRNVTWDYEIGDLLRERVSTLESKFVSHPTIMVDAVDESKGHYTIPNHLAPQDYGYNIIRLYPDTIPGCQKRSVHLNFQKQIIYPGYEDAGLRYGLVAVTASGKPRYSEIYNDDAEFAFDLQPNETELYLVVCGAPTVHHNYAWEIGFPKIYRYPFDFILRNAKPEGFQKGFRSPPAGVTGMQHINGGGFVAATAHVDPSAYVGPLAQVLDQAQVIGDARIEGTAIIKDNAVVEDSAIVSDQAMVGEDAHVFDHAVITDQAHVFGGDQIYGHSQVDGNSLLFFTQVYDDAHLTDNTFCWGANLHGDVYLGGDAEFFSECSDGTYLQFEGAYNRNCDGLDDHPANQEIIEAFIPPKILNQYTLLCDGLAENIFTDFYEVICQGDTLYFNGKAYTQDGSYTFEYEAASGVDSIVTLLVEVVFPPYVVFAAKVCPGDTIWYLNFPFVQGIEYDTIIDDGFCGVHVLGSLDAFDVDTTVLLIGNTLEVQQPAFFVQWYDCETNLPIEGALGKFFTPVNNGYYKAKIISQDTCEAFTGCHHVLGVGIETPEAGIKWTVSPNPVSNVLNLDFTSPLTSRLSLEIVDIFGKIQLREMVADGISSFPIDVMNLLPGLYIIRAFDKDHHFDLRKFVKI
jgi:carbonic anhydrase/acetyltransferase-like protein (isoleucine patch superfamily)